MAMNDPLSLVEITKSRGSKIDVLSARNVFF